MGLGLNDTHYLLLKSRNTIHPPKKRFYPTLIVKLGRVRHFLAARTRDNSHYEGHELSIYRRDCRALGQAETGIRVAGNGRDTAARRCYSFRVAESLVSGRNRNLARGSPRQTTR